MIVNRPNQKYEHLGVTYAIGAAVMATEASEYRGLYGTITEIRDGADRETENDTPDIYCCFEPPLFPKEIRELERRFTELYQAPKKLDEITLDMVIMAPEMVRVISADPSVCKTCKVYLLTMQFTTSWDSGCITELYADYDMARFAMLKGIREEQAEGCVKDWADIGGYRLRDISPMQIQSIMAALSDKSNSLQSKVLIALRSIFKAAQENGLVAKSPVSSMLKPSGKRTAEKVALTPQESDLLLQRVKNERAYTFLLIALQTGMRRGEIVGLQWSDIDFERRMICVRHNAVLGRYETTVSELLKTKAGRRDIPMSDEVEAWLRKQRDRSSSKFVLSLKSKKVMTLSAFRSMWKLVERELPETHITAHILRHTYITRLFEAGLDVKEIQYLAGHSTMDMTLSVYTHYDRKNREQQTAEKVRRAFCKEAV